jgi:hypothetical protein
LEHFASIWCNLWGARGPEARRSLSFQFDEASPIRTGATQAQAVRYGRGRVSDTAMPTYGLQKLFNHTARMFDGDFHRRESTLLAGGLTFSPPPERPLRSLFNPWAIIMATTLGLEAVQHASTPALGHRRHLDRQHAGAWASPTLPRRHP